MKLGNKKKKKEEEKEGTKDRDGVGRGRKKLHMRTSNIKYEIQKLKERRVKWKVLSG